jgi:hypothetical protein
MLHLSNLKRDLMACRKVTSLLFANAYDQSDLIALQLTTTANTRCDEMNALSARMVRWQSAVREYTIDFCCAKDPAGVSSASSDSDFASTKVDNNLVTVNGSREWYRGLPQIEN